MIMKSIRMTNLGINFNKGRICIGLFVMSVAFTVAGRAATDAFSMEVEEIVNRIEEPEIPEARYDIRDYGAVDDGESDALPAIRSAIFECSQAGGGTVSIPSGQWFVKGPIHLKSKIELHLEKGAYVKFSEDTDDYLPVVITRWEGTVCYNYSPLIYAADATDVALTGEGVLDGNSKNGFASWRPNQKPDQLLLRQMGNNLYPIEKRIFGKGHWLRPPFIQFYNCKRVLIEDIKIVESPFWCIHPVFCYNVIVRGVEIESYRLNNDGVDPDSSVNVLIEDCVFRTGDDAVAIKAGRDQDGWRVGQATENVVVRNCKMPAVHNGLAIGSEMSGGVRSVYMENCEIGVARSCLYFKSNLDRGGYIENVRMRNIRVEHSKNAFIDMTTDYHSWRGNHYPPRYSDFIIEDVSCGKADRYGIYAVGKEGALISDVLIKNVSIDSAQFPQRIALVEDFHYENVKINGRDVEVTLIDDVKDEGAFRDSVGH